MASFTKQLTTATSGTVTINDTQQDLILFHDTASLVVSLTTALPATPVDGQKVIIITRSGITTLSITSALTIIGGLTTMAAGIGVTYIYEASNNKWYRAG